MIVLSYSKSSITVSVQIAVWTIFLNFGSSNYYTIFTVDCLAIYFSQCSKEVLNYIHSFFFLLIFLIEVLDQI